MVINNKNILRVGIFIAVFFFGTLISRVTAAEQEQPLGVVVTAAFTSQRGIHSYREIMDYVAEKTGFKFDILSGVSYQMTNRLMKSGKISIAFVCGYAYVREKEYSGLELLVLPVPRDEQEPVYHSYIIVHKDSPYAKLADLKGKNFLFSDVLSNSGYLVPAYKLAQMGHTPQDFFRAYRFSGSHEKSIEEIADKRADAAAVDSLVWDYDHTYYPEFTSQTKIIDISEPVSVVPVVISDKLDKVAVKKIQDALLNMHLDPPGKEILQRALLKKFVVRDDSFYDNMRQMAALVEKLRKAKMK
jgi:phosphonate transport system substrate-binding protein